MNVAVRIGPKGLSMAARLLLLGAAALFAADGVNHWMIGQWSMPQVAPPALEVAKAGPGPKKPRTSYARVTQRNVFNSAPKKGVVHTPAPTTSGPTTPTIQPLNLNVRLTGTVVGASPSQSFAFIMDKAKRDEKLYRVGDKVLGEGVVAEIKRDEVRLTRGAAEQILHLFDPDAVEDKPTRQAGIKPFRGRGGDDDKTNFTLARGEVDEALNDIPKLLTQARLLPNFRAGETDGFRIFNIVPGSLFSKIGLKNGDVLHQINDVPIEDPTKFMAIFQDLRTQTQFTLDLVRRGKKKTLEYEIR